MEQCSDISSAELLDRLLVAIGKGDADAARRAIIECHVQLRINVYQSKAKAYAAVEDLNHRKLLKQVLDTKAKLRELRQQLEPSRTSKSWEAGWDRIHQPDGEASPLIDPGDNQKG